MTYCEPHYEAEAARRTRQRMKGNCIDCSTAIEPGAWRCRRCLDAKCAQQKTKSRRQREMVLKHYGGRCACCGESQYEFLTIDHVNNDGADHRRTGGATANRICLWLVRHGFPGGFQVLCWNCNAAKQFHRGCPHTREAHVEG